VFVKDSAAVAAKDGPCIFTCSQKMPKECIGQRDIEMEKAPIVLATGGRSSGIPVRWFQEVVDQYKCSQRMSLLHIDFKVTIRYSGYI
jgi:hypothetical protein